MSAVTCIDCGRTSPHRMGMIPSKLTDPHRWMCRDRRGCKARVAEQTVVGGFGNQTYGPAVEARYSGDGTPL